MTSLAEQLYHRWRRAQHDITEHPDWGNLASEQRAAWEAVAEAARGQKPLFIAPRSIEAGEVIELRITPPDFAGAHARLERVLNDRSGFHVSDLDDETRADLLDAITNAVLG